MPSNNNVRSGGNGERSQPLTVSAANKRIGGQIESTFNNRPMWLNGTISGLSKSKSWKSNGGHVFFDLAEYSGDTVGGKLVASVGVIVWHDDHVRIKHYLEKMSLLGAVDDGVNVTLRGSFKFSPKYGSVKFHADQINGESLKQTVVRERDRVVGELQRENLLGRNSRVAVPGMPLRVFLVTSKGSAADADVRRVFNDCGYQVLVKDRDVRVQGVSAVGLIVEALSEASESAADVVLLFRGGGSSLELRTFDDIEVARAVALCSKPVFTGIGHETDESVVELVAHSAFATPTAAAEGVVARLRLCAQDIAAERRSLNSAVSRRLSMLRHELGDVETRFGDGLRIRASKERELLTALGGSFEMSVSDCLGDARAMLNSLQREFVAADPTLRLRQGWSLTRRLDGRVVKSWSDVSDGEVITTLLADGLITSVVRYATPDNENRVERVAGNVAS